MSTNIIPSMSTTFFIFFLLFSIIPFSYSARILLASADPSQPFQHPTQPSITFLMQYIQPSSTRNTLNQQQQAPPFSKPLGTYPSTFGSIPLPYQTNPINHNTPTQTPLDMPTFEIAFPATSTLHEELEFGLVTNIEEDIYVENSVYGPMLVGKARGIYVSMNSLEEANHHIMAMTASFTIKNGDDNKSNDEIDSLKFFGVHENKDVLECHVAVIGGTGKFKDANGYAAIRVVSRNYRGSYGIEESSEDAQMMLLYNVYLS